MYNDLRMDDPNFQALKDQCTKRNISLRVALDYKQYQKMGGNYAAYVRFANMQLCVGETLQEIADFLQIGGKYD